MVVRSKINQRLNGQNPLSYLGVDAGQPTDLVTKPRDPTTHDYQQYFLGTFWLNIVTNDLWYLANLDRNVATWLRFGGSSTLLTLTGDTGGAVTGDSLKNINLVSGFSSFSVDGNPGTNTLTLNSNGTIGVSYHTDSGNATPSSNILNIVGGLNINTTGSGNTVTIKTPQLAEGVVYANSSHVFTSLSKGTDGQILIGQTGSTPAWANITSAGGTVTITNTANHIDLAVPAGPVLVTSAFSAYMSTTKVNVLGSSVPYYYVADTEIFDIGGDYDNTTGIFTAPSTGYYLFGAYPTITNGPVTTDFRQVIVGLSRAGSLSATYNIVRYEREAETQPTQMGSIIILPLTMHDTIKPFVTMLLIANVTSLMGSSNPVVTTFFGYRLPT